MCSVLWSSFRVEQRCYFSGPLASVFAYLHVFQVFEVLTNSFSRFGEFRGKKFGRVRYEVASSKRLLHGYFSITFRFLTCVAVALGVGAIFFCLHFDITAKLSVEFIVPAIIFPISFGYVFAGSAKLFEGLHSR